MLLSIEHCIKHAIVKVFFLTWFRKYISDRFKTKRYNTGTTVITLHVSHLTLSLALSLDNLLSVTAGHQGVRPLLPSQCCLLCGPLPPGAPGQWEMSIWCIDQWEASITWSPLCPVSALSPCSWCRLFPSGRCSVYVLEGFWTFYLSRSRWWCLCWSWKLAAHARRRSCMKTLFNFIRFYIFWFYFFLFGRHLKVLDRVLTMKAIHQRTRSQWPGQWPRQN